MKRNAQYVPVIGLVRKCHLQLASEENETSSGCEKLDFHPAQTIRVPVVCPNCVAKLDKQSNMLATIKHQLSEAKTKLRLATDNSSAPAIVEEVNANDGNETFSPLSISFLARGRYCLQSTYSYTSKQYIYI
ncbi:hypothetical protein DHEL01_v211769 [Diaporthe helianthi]|uniref:Uncharacterized protein n=1 Tax=Diaporthe helianthi TaxID=158607 RepID=A0A2P5HHV9_DIAHE|nr:hypothetical protein DHEL01_v211769 [Diaporthe helianthi]